MAKYSKEYGKRPLWQWILIYLVIGGVIYYLIYAVFMRSKGSSLYTAPTSSTAPSTNTTPTKSTAPQKYSY